jgi:hypothetical protein
MRKQRGEERKGPGLESVNLYHIREEPTGSDHLNYSECKGLQIYRERGEAQRAEPTWKVAITDEK